MKIVNMTQNLGRGNLIKKFIHLIINFIFLICLFFPSYSWSQHFSIFKEGEYYAAQIQVAKQTVLRSPQMAYWAIGTAWKDKWVADWKFANPTSYGKSGNSEVLKGQLNLPQGTIFLQDSFETENGILKCTRRFEWSGKDRLDSVTLTSIWDVNGSDLQTFMPGIIHYGNPSGYRNNPAAVPHYFGKEGELAIFEEHRFPIPFVAVEHLGKERYGATLHSRPSPVYNKNVLDQWWSLGVWNFQGKTQLVSMSGPVGYNGLKSVVKALQDRPLDYGNTYIALDPGQIIEKIFYIDAFALQEIGTVFQKPIHDALNIFQPFGLEGFPQYSNILQGKISYAMSRYNESLEEPGFPMLPPRYSVRDIIMGWCGQAEACGYAFQELMPHIKEKKRARDMVQRSLDFLSESTVTDSTFSVTYSMTEKKWLPNSGDHVSTGQAMYNMAKAISSARKSKLYNIKKWELFLKRTCDVVSDRILDPNWNPISTAEAFYIAPLVLGHSLYNNEKFKNAAIRAGEYFAKRHLAMKEPYWGGTLDASAEDKEGAWAAFQGFIYLYEHFGGERYLKWAKHAGDVCLSYTYFWNVPLPPGRLADHGLMTRGWTVVSPQNQHVDVYGVLFSPEIYKLGRYLKDERYRKIAKVMYVSCGQLMDIYGSQGEQVQQTNFAQQGEMNNVYKLRGGYSENWQVFWITTHFLSAAARFQEMQVDFVN